MIREETFYYLSLISYYNVKKVGTSLSKLCQMIVKDEEVLRQAEEIDDAKGNLEMIKRIPRSFQNLDEIKEASVEVLTAIPSMNEKAAKSVYNFFHP